MIFAKRALLLARITAQLVMQLLRMFFMNVAMPVAFREPWGYLGNLNGILI